jgi:hypothetical protein
MTPAARDQQPIDFTPVRGASLQRRCACGGTAGPDGECAECRRNRLNGHAPSQDDAMAPDIVRDVLRGPGQPLDLASRAAMELRFGHDFGRVQIYRGDRASESARAIDARAYAVGSKIVLGGGFSSLDSGDGQRLLAHELAHVVQQRASDGAGLPATLRVGRTDSAAEREAAVAERPGAATDTGTSAFGAITPSTVQRQPAPVGQLNLTIGEDGKVDLSVSGPNAPVIGNPTIGIRRKPDGSYDLIVGGKGKTVAAGAIPQLLRSALGPGAQPGTKRTSEFRLPTCSQLRAPRGGYMNWNEYRVSQMLSTNLMPMTPTFYDALIETCRPKPIEIPEEPSAPAEEAVPPITPEGTAVA